MSTAAVRTLGKGLVSLVAAGGLLTGLTSVGPVAQAATATPASSTTSTTSAVASVASARASARAMAAPAARDYGVQLHSLWSENTPADVSKQLDLLAATKANSARVDVAWASLQTDGRGTINSSYAAKLDAFVAGATRRGISVLPVLTETPCWASSAPASLVQGCAGAYWDRGVTRWAPTSSADFAWAARWVAQRYGSKLAGLELWNEPNYNENGYSPLTAGDRAATYTAMVKAAYPAIKSVAPGLPVLMGSMSFSDTAFLSSLYSHGIKGYYDGVSVHPYNEWRRPGQAWSAQWKKYDYVLGLQSVRALMLANGDSTPLWITEMGWTTCTINADKWCVTEAQQAEFLAAAAKMTSSWNWVRGFYAYNLRNKGTDISYTEDNFGLVTHNYRVKPALRTLAVAFAGLRASGSTGSSNGAGATTPRPTGPFSLAVRRPVLNVVTGSASGK